MNKKAFIVIIRDFILGIVSGIINLLRILTLSKRSQIPKKRPGREEIIIISNGPSIASIQDRLIQSAENMSSMMVNFAPNTTLYTQVKPEYLILSAPELWMEDVDDHYVSRAQELFGNISQLTDWNMRFLIPHEASRFKKWQEAIRQNQKIEIVYYNNTPIEGESWLSFFFFRQKLGMPRPHNITIPALMSAIWMNYKKIYLVGVDHSWLPEISVDQENNVLIHQKHFYDSQTSAPRHMTKLGKGKRKLHEVLEKFVIAFKGYHSIQAFAKSLDISIYNQTKDSFIDAFERQDLPD
jgi:hypothetical protein